MIAQMGVDTLVLTAARKVPKDYFGSHLFRKPELLVERLIGGLCQAGDVQLPQVHVSFVNCPTFSTMIWIVYSQSTNAPE
jgi:hypothetical protein